MREFALLLLIGQSLLLFVTGEASEVCHGDLGCFSMGHPWTTLTRKLPPPHGIDDVGAELHFYTMMNRDIPYIVTPKSVSNLDECNYDPKHKTNIFFHGYGDTVNGSMKMIKSDNGNDIHVGYRSYEYDQTCSNGRVVAAFVAQILKLLIFGKGANPATFHLIGFSLGAHLASYVCKAIPGIGRLTGLDPAVANFQNEHPEVRLNKGDSLFVDVIHTSVAGTWTSEADVDFYFNGGKHQPNCGMSTTKDGTYDPLSAVVKGVECSHGRAILYCAEALRNTNCTFWGVKRSIHNRLLTVMSLGWLSRTVTSKMDCDLDTCSPFNCNTADYPARGSFIVSTSHEKPYCAVHKEIDLAMERKMQYFRSKQQ